MIVFLLLWSILSLQPVYALPKDETVLFQYMPLSESKKVLKFDNSKNEYVVVVGAKSYSYQRDAFRDILTNHPDLTLNPEDAKTLEDALNRHSSFMAIQDPTDRELLSHALSMKEIFEKIDFSDPAHCLTISSELNPATIELADADEIMKIDELAIRSKMKEDGFVLLGDLVKGKVELMSSNDNIFHGLTSPIGLGTGDDRGQTFGISMEGSLEFTEGELSLRKFSDGFGRAKMHPRSVINIKNNTYHTVWFSHDEEGKAHQEFLSIDGIELEVRKTFPAKDVYVRLTGRKTTMDDNSGIAREIQESWHNQDVVGIKYHYLEHIDKKKFYSGEVGIGKNYKLLSSPSYRISGNTEISHNFSPDVKEEGYTRVRGDLKIRPNGPTNPNEKFPKWDASIYLDTKLYTKGGEVDKKYGVELTRRWALGKNGYYYIAGGLAVDDNRHAREYGKEEIIKKGELDIQHYLGTGYEHKF